MIDFVAASTHYINCASGASIDDVNPRTVAGWIKVDDISAASYLVTKRNNTNGLGWSLNILDQAGTSDFKIRLFEHWDSNNGKWDSDNNFSYGQWYHLALTYDSGAVTNDPVLYVNAVAEAMTEVDTPAGSHTSDAAQNLIIGVFSEDLSSSPFDGKTEDMRIFDSILTPEQAAHLAAGYRGPLGGEALWLSMNEARTLLTSGTLTQGTHLLSDLSANSNDGDPYNGCVLKASNCPRMGVTI